MREQKDTNKLIYMGEKKKNLPLTIIGAIAVPLILLFVVVDIVNDLRNSNPYGNSVMFAWIIYIIVIAVFEYYWLNR